MNGGRGAWLLLVASVATSGCITDRVLRDDGDGAVGVDDAVVARAKHTTEVRRGLPFDREVPLEVLTVKELEDWLNRYYDRYQVALQRRDRFNHKMGILPPTRDSASTWKGFVGGFAGGIYDDSRVGPDGERGTMLLISDYAWWSKVQLDLFGLLTGVDYAYEVFLVHELTHALQDQHLHLGRLLDGDDDDKRMVRKTIIESEANVIGMAHFAGIDLEQAAPRTAFFWFLRYNNLFNGPMLAGLAGKTPSFFSRQAFSQYELGLGFVEERLNRGGWLRAAGDVDDGPLAELSRAYVRVPGTVDALPESTEQLLFPWKRGEHPDRPIAIAPLPTEVDALPEANGVAVDGTVDDAPAVKAPTVARFHGMEVIDSGVFGALALKHWIEGPLQLGAESVVDGWGGDRYEVLIDAAEQTVLLWRFLGDSDDDAAQIRRALVDRFAVAHGPDRLTVTDDGDRRYAATVSPAPDERRYIKTVRPEHLIIERRGAAVVVIVGLDADEEVLPLIDTLFALTTPHTAGVVDDAERARVAEALEATQRATLAAMPPPTPPSLHDQLILPARTMAVRLGATAFVTPPVDDEDNAPPSVLVVPDGEARWGVRPNLELSLPFAATLHTTLGPFLVGAGVLPVRLPLFSPLSGVWAGRGVVTTSWAVGDLGAAVQLELGAHASGAPAVDTPNTTALAARAGLLLRPLPGLVIQPAVELADRTDTFGADDGFVADTFRLGGVMQRGFLDAPLVELELVGGLRLTLTQSVTWRVPPPSTRVGWGLTVVESRFGAGLMLVF